MLYKLWRKQGQTMSACCRRSRIGGTMDKAAVLEKALLRPIGTHHVQEHLKGFGTDIIEKINQLGRAQGLGGNITALAVHVEAFATHIAAL